MSEETGWAYQDNEYWDKVRKSRDDNKEEHCTVEGNDGECEFDKRLLEAVKGKKVLDVGSGIGTFTLEIAKKAKNVVGIDFSKVGIDRAIKNQSGQASVQFKQANAEDLPFSDEEFDVIVSRRGPATSSMKSLREAYRVLKENGILMEITIGEKDKENITKIFGRGQMYGVKEKVVITKGRMLRDCGFRATEIKDHLANEIFATINDLIVRLNSAPIIPNFDKEKDRNILSRVDRVCKTERGIESPVHRVTIIGQKVRG